jgi:hypothetical protein
MPRKMFLLLIAVTSCDVRLAGIFNSSPPMLRPRNNLSFQLSVTSASRYLDAPITSRPLSRCSFQMIQSYPSLYLAAIMVIGLSNGTSRSRLSYRLPKCSKSVGVMSGPNDKESYIVYTLCPIVVL